MLTHIEKDLEIRFPWDKRYRNGPVPRLQMYDVNDRGKVVYVLFQVNMYDKPPPFDPIWALQSHTCVR